MSKFSERNDKTNTMFGDLLGGMQEKQEAIQKKLAVKTVSSEAGDGAVKIEANALRQILNISINKEKLASDDPEELEDLLLTAINRALEQAAEIEAAESKNMISDILPPGLGNMFGNM